ncbi:MAG: DUF520 family protein [Betaproteobacteria bacterium]|nr:DUF520 family protein [Betaproteobacteria bacterium]
MPSFDVVCEANMVEVKNAVEQSNKEISTRFDFKGSDARIEIKELELTAYADDDFKLSQIRDVLWSKCAKRQLDVRFLDSGDCGSIQNFRPEHNKRSARIGLARHEAPPQHRAPDLRQTWDCRKPFR